MKDETVIKFEQFFTNTAVPVTFRVENAEIIVVNAPTGPLGVGVGQELVILPAGGMYTRQSPKEEKVSKK